MKDDAFRQLFNAVDPVKGLGDKELDAIFPADRVLRRIQTEYSSKQFRGFRHRSWRRTAIVSISAILVFAGTAAAITLLRSPVSNTYRFSCYSQDSLHSRVVEEFSYSSHPLELCHSELKWKRERKGATPSGFLCVLLDGSLAGFPPSAHNENCAKLGLAVFNGRLKYPRVLSFENLVERYFSKNQCVSISTAQKRVLLLIGKYGLVGWRIRTSGSDSRVACATFGIQVGSRIIDIVGIDIKTPMAD